MADYPAILLATKLNRLGEQIRAFEAAAATDAQMSELHQRYANELGLLTDSEAVAHLRSIDDSEVPYAYLIISKRLDPSLLAAVCLQYLERTGRLARLTGASAIGSCLKGTSNDVASRALAQMVRNPEEPIEIRLAAYGSLELINWRRRSDPGEKTEEGNVSHLFRDGLVRDVDVYDAIDWGFVDSFG